MRVLLNLLSLALGACVILMLWIAYGDAQVIRDLKNHGLTCSSEFVGSTGFGLRVTTCKTEPRWLPASEKLPVVEGEDFLLYTCEAKRDSGIVVDTAYIQCQWARPAISFASAGTNG